MSGEGIKVHSRIIFLCIALHRYSAARKASKAPSRSITCLASNLGAFLPNLTIHASVSFSPLISTRTLVETATCRAHSGYRLVLSFARPWATASIRLWSYRRKQRWKARRPGQRPSLAYITSWVSSLRYCGVTTVKWPQKALQKPGYDVDSDKLPQSQSCQEHSVPFKKHEKEGRVWYSHKGPDGKWCKEK